MRVSAIIVNAEGNIEALRYCIRKACNNKRKLESEDLLQWFSYTDENKIDLPFLARLT